MNYLSWYQNPITNQINLIFLFIFSLYLTLFYFVLSIFSSFVKYRSLKWGFFLILQRLFDIKKRGIDKIALKKLSYQCPYLYKNTEVYYANFAFATSTNALNPSASFTASSANIFLFTVTSANFKPYMNLL